ncbi:hypothetical protein [Agarivorans sp. Z349TD_8]|uniref:hypothetical protein n=1 Tax=Agarivorans sp. Z349TD_8 TaxID=3421434 RepID=UPI003F6BAE5E
MKHIGRILLLSCSAVYIVACGGGGSESTTPPANTSSSDMIKNPLAYSVKQLNQAAESLVDLRYTGAQVNAPMDVALAQQLFTNLFGDSVNALPSLLSYRLIEQVVEAKGEVNSIAQCTNGGTLTYKGYMDSNYQGTISLDYDACIDDAGAQLDGQAAFRMVQLNENIVDYVLYYDNLNWQRSELFTVITGYSRQVEDSDSLTQSQRLLFSSNDHAPVMLHSAYNEDSGGSWSVSGDLFIADKGKVAFSSDELSGSISDFGEGSLLLVGDKATALQFDNKYIRYVEDINSDKLYDVGTYFSNVQELLVGDVSAKQLVALSELSLPPLVSEPYWNMYGGDEVDTTTPITVEQGYYEDPDTSDELLNISYHWYVNGTRLAETSSTLAPYQAIYGDLLEVSMVVFDGVNSVEGPRLTIELSDSPVQVAISNLPENVVRGELVSFSVNMVDPDLQGVQAPVVMASGPSGATMDEQGEVNWQVPDNLLFPVQQYTFSFSLPGSDDVELVTVEAHSNDNFPIVRTGTEVPYHDHSTWIGNFDQFEGNEILTVGHNSTVYLMEYVNEGYQQKWVYPFALPAAGKIKQAIPADIDNDGQQEIIVVSDHGISLISDLTSMATLLLYSDKYLQHARIVETESGWLLGYLEANSEYSYDHVVLKVVNIEQPNTLLFSRDLLSAKQFVFANVDGDAQLEIVTNNGFVYDTETWENQWFYSDGFGRSLVAAGDIDGDGIAEIIGDTVNHLSIYSAIDKSQRYQYSGNGYCDLITADVSKDGVDEVILGGCQWGNIEVLQWDGASLLALSQVSSQGYGIASLAVGDSDNDGLLEMHWASDVGSSGEDLFIIADLTEGAATIKPRTRVQLDNYSTAGWSTITDNIEKAVFFVPSSESGYGGGRIFTLDKQGHTTVSDELSSNWDKSKYAITSDFNHDGFGDMFVPITETYYGGIAALQLFDNSVHWQLAGDYDTDIGVIEASDLNGDGKDDLIYDEGSAIRVIDIDNQTILGSYRFDQYVKDITSYSSNDGNYVIVGLSENVSLLKVQNGVITLLSSQQQACRRVEMFNYDNDDALELMCFDEGTFYDQTSTFIVYEINNETLIEVSRVRLLDNVLDIAIDPSSRSQQNVFAAIKVPEDYQYDIEEKYYIQKMSAKGLAIWSSPYIVGEPQHRGINLRYSQGALEMLISTNKAAYWLH